MDERTLGLVGEDKPLTLLGDTFESCGRTPVHYLTSMDNCKPILGFLDKSHTSDPSNESIRLPHLDPPNGDIMLGQGLDNDVFNDLFSSSESNMGITKNIMVESESFETRSYSELSLQEVCVDDELEELARENNIAVVDDVSDSGCIITTKSHCFPGTDIVKSDNFISVNGNIPENQTVDVVYGQNKRKAIPSDSSSPLEGPVPFQRQDALLAPKKLHVASVTIHHRARGENSSEHLPVPSENCRTMPAFSVKSYLKSQEILLLEDQQEFHIGNQLGLYGHPLLDIGGLLKESRDTDKTEQKNEALEEPKSQELQACKPVNPNIGQNVHTEIFDDKKVTNTTGFKRPYCNTSLWRSPPQPRRVTGSIEVYNKSCFEDTKPFINYQKCPVNTFINPESTGRSLRTSDDRSLMATCTPMKCIQERKYTLMTKLEECIDKYEANAGLRRIKNNLGTRSNAIEVSRVEHLQRPNISESERVAIQTYFDTQMTTVLDWVEKAIKKFEKKVVERRKNGKSRGRNNGTILSSSSKPKEATFQASLLPTDFVKDSRSPPIISEQKRESDPQVRGPNGNVSICRETEFQNYTQQHFQASNIGMDLRISKDRSPLTDRAFLVAPSKFRDQLENSSLRYGEQCTHRACKTPDSFQRNNSALHVTKSKPAARNKEYKTMISEGRRERISNLSSEKNKVIRNLLPSLCDNSGRNSIHLKTTNSDKYLGDMKMTINECHNSSTSSATESIPNEADTLPIDVSTIPIYRSNVNININDRESSDITVPLMSGVNDAKETCPSNLWKTNSHSDRSDRLHSSNSVNKPYLLNNANTDCTSMDYRNKCTESTHCYGYIDRNNGKETVYKSDIGEENIPNCFSACNTLASKDKGCDVSFGFDFSIEKLNSYESCNLLQNDSFEIGKLTVPSPNTKYIGIKDNIATVTRSPKQHCVAASSNVCLGEESDKGVPVKRHPSSISVKQQATFPTVCNMNVQAEVSAKQWFPDKNCPQKSKKMSHTKQESDQSLTSISNESGRSNKFRNGDDNSVPCFQDRDQIRHQPSGSNLNDRNRDVNNSYLSKDSTQDVIKLPPKHVSNYTSVKSDPDDAGEGKNSNPLASQAQNQNLCLFPGYVVFKLPPGLVQNMHMLYQGNPPVLPQNQKYQQPPINGEPNATMYSTNQLNSVQPRNMNENINAEWRSRTDNFPWQPMNLALPPQYVDPAPAPCAGPSSGYPMCMNANQYRCSETEQPNPSLSKNLNQWRCMNKNVTPMAAIEATDETSWISNASEASVERQGTYQQKTSLDFGENVQHPFDAESSFSLTKLLNMDFPDGDENNNLSDPYLTNYSSYQQEQALESNAMNKNSDGNDSHKVEHPHHSSMSTNCQRANVLRNSSGDSESLEGELKTELFTLIEKINQPNTEVDPAIRILMNKKTYSGPHDRYPKLAPRDQSCTSVSPSPKSTTKRTRAKLPSLAKRIMERWYEQNIGEPYPTVETAECIAQSSGISVEQVKKWFANKRMRNGNTRRVCSNQATHKRQSSYQRLQSIAKRIKEEHFENC